MEDNILIVDDEPNVISALTRVFIDEPYRIYSANSAPKAMEILKKHSIKVVISDERMPEISGSEFLSMVREQFPNIIRIMLTGHASIDSAMKAINEGEIYRFFTKPWNDMDIRFAVKAAIDKYNLEEENRRLLDIIRQQALNIKLLERQFPGISQLDRDENGRIVLPDISEEEMTNIIARCEKEFI
ncbi:MAG: response regulator [Nitrospiraceae bacterium]|nr:response regulator [Nitrospirota bacterium]MDA8338722.1 response regulator [Nitrospiraceae bacterium]